MKVTKKRDVTKMGKARDMYRIFVGKPLVKGLQRRPRRIFNL